MRALAIVAATTMMTFAAQAQETEIPLSDVPEVVMDAAHLAAEGVTFKTVAVEDMGGENKYGFSGTMADGTQVDVDVSEEAEVLEVEHIITLDALPDDVQSILDAYVPNLTPTEVERTADDERAVIYEIEGKDAGGQDVDIEISWDGSEITIEPGG